MAVIIEKIIDHSADNIYAQVKHNKNMVHAYIVGPIRDIANMINEEIMVEIGFDKINSWSEIKNFNDNNSGMKEDNPTSIRIAGRVHNAVVLDDGAVLLDLYLMNGADFLTIQSKDIGDHIPKEGSGLEIVVGKLLLYPTNLEVNTTH